ncbi:ATP-binding protein [Aeromicrobium sp. CF3.5]|uniref:ATP-binding protein n=1 Tax=Aeromicrobium sp. CF3.5 TaxID=3373078 RepID=UPI003EE60FCA
MKRTILGRDEWILRLHADIDRTTSSHGGLLLISGEAGIGKTTLVAGLIERARDQGAIAVVGTCSGSASAPDLWPWTQIVRAIQRALGTAAFDEFATSVGLDASDLVPAAGRAADLADHQFALFDATAAMLSAISHHAPLVLVLEDLHWADEPSVELLDFLARHAWFERILLVATYRDTEVSQPGHPLHQQVSVLSPQAGSIQLTGLDQKAVASLLRRVTGHEPEDSFVAFVHRRTGGNPFFIEQTARLWAGGHDPQVIPPGVTEAVRRRLDGMSTDTVKLLQAAAILGASFTYTLLCSVLSMRGARVSTAIATALSARLLQVSEHGSYAFVHDLVRETVLADLSEHLAATLHAAVVEALADLSDELLPGQAAEHAVRAAHLVPSERTVDLLVAAGRDANARMAPAEAIEFYRRAAEVTQDHDRAILIRLDLSAEVYFKATMNRQSTLEAAELFDGLIIDAEDASAAVAARVALAAMDHADIDAVRADALLRSSARHVLGFTPPENTLDLADVLSRDLADAARAGSDDTTLSNVLTARHAALWQSGKARERYQLMAELVTVARRTGARDAEQFATSMLWVSLLELNDPAYLEQYRAFVALSSRYKTPRFSVASHVDTVVIACFRGRFAEAFESFAGLQEQIPHEDLYWWMAQYVRWLLHLRQGDLTQAGSVMRRLVRTDLDYSIILAAQACEEGRFAEAAEHLRSERIAPSADDAAPTRGHSMTLQPLRDRVCAQVAAGTGDPDFIAVARERLGPHSGTWSVDIFGIEIGGPIDMYLGAVEARAGNTVQAIALLERAVRAAEQMSTPYWATASRLTLIESLAPDEPRRAELIDQTASVLADLDAKGLQSRLEAICGDTAPKSPRPQVSVTGSRIVGQFRREATVWMIGLGEELIPVPDTKGMGDLHSLISNPGVEISSMQLLNPTGAADIDRATRFGGDPMVDQTAREQYRARLNTLDAMLDEAGWDGHVARRDELSAERDALIAELRAATGLGGRSRVLGDQAERARKTVSARIRDTFRKLDTQHRALAAHLRDSVSTGTHCRYSPSVPVDWRLR